MRYLHAISPVEAFIASGQYQDTNLKIIQQWTIHQLPDYAWLIRVDHIHQNILIEAWRSPQSMIERVDVRTLNYPMQRINYTLENGVVEYGHTDGKAPRIEKTLTVSSPLLALPSIIGISLALSEWRTPQPTVTTLDLLSLDLITLPISPHDWQKSVLQFNAHGIPQHYQDQSGEKLTLTHFAPHHSFNLSLRENL
jgi:hypothetical protein